MTSLTHAGQIREAAPRVAVLGDFLLDDWWSGRVERVAREAPAPVVDLLDHHDVPGGAANTARVLASLGARVRALGLLGADDAGHRLRRHLGRAGIDTAALRQISGTRTTTKVRVSVGEHVLIRLDRAEWDGWPAAALTALVEDARRALPVSDALLICDYGSGISGDAVISALSRLPRPALVVVDSHDPARWRDLGPDLITPNAAEAERALGFGVGEAEHRISAVAQARDQLLERTGAGAAVVTLDRAGTLLLRPDREPYRTYARPVPEHRASGAGDVFAAALTVSTAAGVPLEGAVELAQRAADIAVRSPGTSTCSLHDLETAPGRTSDVVISWNRLADVLSEARRAGRRIVLTNGCFDVLHRGHITYLGQAKQLGDVLVVGVNDDASARRLKGPDSPVNGVADRASVLAELSCVDYVIVFGQDTATELIRRFTPDVYVKGGDYSPEMMVETAEVRRLGGRVVTVDYVPDHSTTEMFGRIRAQAGALRVNDAPGRAEPRS